MEDDNRGLPSRLREAAGGRPLALRWCGWAIVGVGVLLAGGGCREPSRQVVVIGGAASTFWEAVRSGALSAAADLDLAAAGLEVVVQPADGAPEHRLALLREAAARPNLAGVAIDGSQMAGAGLAEQLRGLRGRGIPVVTLGGDVEQKDRNARVAFVGSSERTAGIALGAAARTLLPDGGGFVTFVANASAKQTMDRIAGFAEGAGTKFEELDSLPDQGEPARTRENLRSAILHHGEKLKVLVAVGPQTAAPIVEALREELRREQFVILAFDALPKTMQAVGEGDVDAVVVQNPYGTGYEAVRLLAALILDDQAAQKAILPKQGQPGGDVLDTGVRIVVPDVGSPLSQEALAGKAELFHLSQFRQWLYERNLSGS